MTSLDVDHKTVVEVAAKGGRQRWRAENEGFNTQKNIGLNLEHADSHTGWAAYSFLLRIAHLLLQPPEKGSLPRRLARERGKQTAVELFGSLKNMAQRRLESLRYWHWPDEVFDRPGCGRIPIRLDSSQSTLASGSIHGSGAFFKVRGRCRSRRASSPSPHGLFRHAVTCRPPLPLPASARRANFSGLRDTFLSGKTPPGPGNIIPSH